MEEKATAMVLSENKRYAHAVWHAQQACELGLKSLMMRTCGVTDDELRGKRAHNLAGFVSSIGGQATCPVAHQDLNHLSSAYLRARYTSKYERSTSMPADLYGADDAERALHHAAELISWIGSRDHAPAPQYSSARRTDQSSRMRGSGQGRAHGSGGDSGKHNKCGLRRRRCRRG